ncbi:MAG: DUF6115 domain-containing protein [Campylobacter sp.]
MSEILILAIFAILLVLIAAYVFLKDADANKKFARYERVIEALVQENHSIKKQLKNSQPISDFNQTQIDLNEMEKKLEAKLNQSINSQIIPILSVIQGLESSIDSFQNEQQNKLYTIEERTKNIGKISSFADDNDEIRARIIAMYQSGKSKETIAKNLGIGVGKVEFELKMGGVM